MCEALRREYGGSNALMCAERSGFERGVLHLMPYSDLSANNRLGQTAMEVALAHGHLSIVARNAATSPLRDRG